MTDQVKPQPLLSDEEIQDQLRPFEDMVVIDSELDVEVNLAFFKAVCAQAKLAALPRSEPKEAGDEYEGGTAKGWYEAWNRENDAWQKMVQHHEELEEAVKVMLKDGMKPTEYLEAMEKVRRILAIEGSAPAKSAPEAEGVRALVKAIKEAAWYRGTEGGMDRDWEENAEGVEPIALDATEIWPAYQAVKAALGDL